MNELANILTSENPRVRTLSYRRFTDIFFFFYIVINNSNTCFCYPSIYWFLVFSSLFLFVHIFFFFFGSIFLLSPFIVGFCFLICLFQIHRNNRLCALIVIRFVTEEACLKCNPFQSLDYPCKHIVLKVNP